jgi:archaellum component FlaC
MGIKMEENDFGFTAMTFDDISAILEESKNAEINTVEEQYKNKIETLKKMILALLNNLASNPEKEYIYWPNRVEKIKEQIEKVKKIAG